MNTPVLIGIDPAFRKNGFAMCVFDPSDKSLRFRVFRDMVEFLGWATNDRPAEAVCFVENSNLDSAVFRLVEPKRGKSGTIRGPADTLKTAAAKGIAVGKNQAISQTVVDLLRVIYTGPNVGDIAPSKKGGGVYGYQVAVADALNLCRTDALPADVLKALQSEDCRSALQMCRRAEGLFLILKKSLK